MIKKICDACGEEIEDKNETRVLTLYKEHVMGASKDYAIYLSDICEYCYQELTNNIKEFIMEGNRE